MRCAPDRGDPEAHRCLPHVRRSAERSARSGSGESPGVRLPDGSRARRPWAQSCDEEILDVASITVTLPSRMAAGEHVSEFSGSARLN